MKELQRNFGKVGAYSKYSCTLPPKPPQSTIFKRESKWGDEMETLVRFT